MKPKTAEVYIDGRYVGTAGSFDGFPGYLWLEAGAYHLALVEDGYASLDREIEVAPGQVIDFKLRLEPGIASRPEPRSDRDHGSHREGDYRSEGRRDYPSSGDDGRRDSELVLDVRPGDASVYLDGHFIGTGDEVSTSTEPLVVEAGPHTLQVVHPDWKTDERAITMQPGEEKLVEVSLHRGGGV